jgi:hypothetical protein
MLSFAGIAPADAPGVPSIAARATLFAEIFAKLEEAYYARLRVFPLKFLLVRLKPAVRRRIIKAATAQPTPPTASGVRAISAMPASPESSILCARP